MNDRVKQNANEPAFGSGVSDGVHTSYAPGMTKREYIATMVLQGLVAHYGAHNAQLEEVAVDLTDSLLAHLDGSEIDGPDTDFNGDEPAKRG